MTKIYTRYTDNSGSISEFKDKPYFESEVLKLMFWWCSAGGLVADFTEVMRHCASVALCNWILANADDYFVENYDKSTKSLPRRAKADVATAIRFYEPNQEICRGLNLDDACSHVRHLFHYWASLDMHKKDFVAYMEDLADESRYNYEIRESMKGLGGCPSNDEVELSLYQEVASELQ